MAVGRLRDPAEDLQQGRFAGAVAADDPDRLARLDLERDALQGPEFIGRGARTEGRPGEPLQAVPGRSRSLHHGFPQGTVSSIPSGPETIELRQVFDGDRGLHINLSWPRGAEGLPDRPCRRSTKAVRAPDWPTSHVIDYARN